MDLKRTVYSRVTIKSEQHEMFQALNFKALLTSIYRFKLVFWCGVVVYGRQANVRYHFYMTRTLITKLLLLLTDNFSRQKL